MPKKIILVVSNLKMDCDEGLTESLRTQAGGLEATRELAFMVLHSTEAAENLLSVKDEFDEILIHMDGKNEACLEVLKSKIGNYLPPVIVLKAKDIDALKRGGQTEFIEFGECKLADLIK